MNFFPLSPFIKKIFEPPFNLLILEVAKIIMRREISLKGILIHVRKIKSKLSHFLNLCDVQNVRLIKMEGVLYIMSAIH